MRLRAFLLPCLLSFFVALAAAFWVRSPGYMDADYYYATAIGLARGEGFRESFLWNYLDDPTGLPHPSHLYWMPLTTMTAALPMALAEGGFRTAQFPFLLLTALLPAVSGLLAFSLSNRRDLALQAAYLSALPGFFLPFFVTTDAFSLCAVLGGLLLLTLQRSQQAGLARWLLVGALVGAAHLARADGLLWLIPCAWVWLTRSHRRPLGLLAMLAGYAAIMAPWWFRNLNTVGVAFPPGGAKALWLTSYDELFTYPAALLTPAHWLASGFPAIVRARLDALLMNTRSLVLVNGLVFLLPLAGLAAWQQRRSPAVVAGTAYLLVLLTSMSLVFPFAGARGGFFHSSAFLMPLVWSLAPTGLAISVTWASARRGWNLAQAGKVFAVAAIVLAAGLTAGIFAVRAIGPDPGAPRWQAGAAYADRVAESLARLDVSLSVAAVNNPPALQAASSRPAVVIPDGGVEALQAVADRYDVRWVVLDANRPEGLRSLYENPSLVPWLRLEATLDGMNGKAFVLRVVQDGQGG